MDRRSIFLTVVGSGLVSGYIYNFNIPQTLQIPLRQDPYNFTTTEFNLIFFFTFLPTPLFDIPVGFLMGKVSLKKSMTIILTLSIFSMIMIALLFQFRIQGYVYILMLMRAIFGFAGEAAFTGIGLFVQQYATQNYEMVMGLCFTFPFLFDSLNSVITTSVYDSTGNLPLPWFIGCIFGVYSLVCLGLMSRYITKKQINQKSILQQSLSNPQLTQSSQEQEDFKCSDIPKMGKCFWIIIITIFFTEGCSSPFLDNLDQLIVKRFGITYIDSGKLLLIPYTLLAFFSFFISRFLSKYPTKRRAMFTFSSILFSLTMLSLYFFPNNDSATFGQFAFLIVYFVSLGFYIAVNYTNIYTVIPLVVSKKGLGTAWGFLGLVVGGSQAIIPVINSAVMNIGNDLVKSYEYLTLCGFFITLIPLGLALYIQNAKLFEVMDMKLKDKKKERIQEKQFSKKQQIISEDTIN